MDRNRLLHAAVLPPAVELLPRSIKNQSTCEPVCTLRQDLIRT